jgi:endonuclease YncB( thermonuclease family)
MFKIISFLMLISSTALAGSTYVIDGDTISLDGTTYRINGIDAPEAAQSCKTASGRDWPCGKVATETMMKLVKNKRVHCESLGLDSYDRHIGRCYAGRMDLAQGMVKQGMAWAFIKFSDEYAPIQAKAKRRKLGVWQGKSQAPWDFRSQKWKAAAQKAPKGCPIKGNISASGHIYHPPWSKWYSRTRIDTAKGERWFCDEAEAIAAGWRAPRNK